MADVVDSRGYLAERERKALPPAYNKPGQLRQEYLVSQALEVASIPADEIRKLRPQVPQQLMPPRYGYDQTPLTIEDVLNTNRWQPTRRSWVSGAPVMLTRYQLVADDWVGTSRNDMRGMT